MKFPHKWEFYEAGDFPRWTRYFCIKCGTYAQFHNRFPIGEQTRKTCPV